LAHLEIVASAIAFFALVLSWFALPSESQTTLASAEPVPTAA
jgi:hypothetical protein